MSFLAGERVWLLLGVAAIAIGYVFMQRRRRHYAVRFTNLSLLASVAPKRPGWRRHIASVLLLAALASLVIAFARPARNVQVTRRGGTVMLAIDVSASMAADDVQPTRLIAAKRAATQFTQQLPSGFRLGLITFDGTARVLVNPTADHASVRAAINGLSLGESTAAGEAVYTALDVLAEGKAAKDSARIVLM